jgi:hypothetical protein
MLAAKLMETAGNSQSVTQLNPKRVVEPACLVHNRRLPFCNETLEYARSRERATHIDHRPARGPADVVQPSTLRAEGVV